MRSIGFATSITAEFWALRDGLKLALNAGIQRLIMELDAKVMVDLVKSNAVTNKPYPPLLYDYRSLLIRFLQVQVTHVYSEGNRCADVLARWGSTMAKVFVVFDYPPNPDILYLVNLDIAGVYVNRIIEPDLTSSVR